MSGATSARGDEQLAAAIGRICEQAIDEQVFPGCTVGWIRSEQAEVRAFGRLTYEPDSPAVTPQTVYDVASVTKSVPTNSLILQLIEQGELELEDEVIRYLPELHNEYREAILLRHLLSYTVVFDVPGGLGALAQAARDATLQRLMDCSLLAPPGEKYFYTNAPALLLGLIAERVSGHSLDKLAERAFFGPLNMTRTTFRPHFPAADIAPTERNERGEVRGQVHDEAAWVLQQTGLVPGHAGLFSTAGDLLNFAQMLLNKGTWRGQQLFTAETVRLMHTNQIAYLHDSAGLGWELNSPTTMGAAGSDQRFGKTGFTGCLMVVDPVRNAAFVHLSNRTWPQRAASREGINAVRRALADAVLAGS